MAIYYTCTNPECDNFGKEQTFHKTECKWNAEKKCFFPEERLCSSCGEVMEIRETVNDDPSSVTFSSFGSMTPEQKRESIKKRSEILDKANDAAGVKEHYKNKAINKFFGK